jgi:SpoIIAA-like
VIERFAEVPAGVVGFRFAGLTHLSKWECTALVSDADWARHAISLFGWLVPGDVRVFPLAELEEAKAWLAG